MASSPAERGRIEEGASSKGLVAIQMAAIPIQMRAIAIPLGRARIRLHGRRKRFEAPPDAPQAARDGFRVIRSAIREAPSQVEGLGRGYGRST